MQSKIAKNILCFLVVGLVSLLFGCNEKKLATDIDSSKASIAVSTPESAKSHEQKPGANIRLLSANQLVSEPNRISDDVISVNLPRDKEWQVKLTSDAEVEIQSVAQLIIPAADLSSAPGQSKFDIPVRWLAKKSGHFYLHVHFSHQSSDSSEARDLGLILEVQERASAVKSSVAIQKPKVEKKLSSSSSNLIELPAEEKIHTKK